MKSRFGREMLYFCHKHVYAALVWPLCGRRYITNVTKICYKWFIDFMHCVISLADVMSYDKMKYHIFTQFKFNDVILQYIIQNDHINWNKICFTSL